MSQKEYSNTYMQVLGVAGLGLFLSTLDSGVINVALPFLQSYFNSTVAHMSWTISLYFLVLSASIVFLGKMADRFGRKRIFAGGLMVFALGSLLCGSAVTANQLIVFRVVQALGASAMQATAAALITTLMPPQHKNKALGSLGLIIGMGPILGPSLAGIMITFFSWRWLFWINIPLCCIGLWVTYRLHDHGAYQIKPFDIWGAICFALFIFSLSFLITLSGHMLGHVWMDGLMALTLVFLLLFIIIEKKTKHPMLDLKWFVDPASLMPFLGALAFGLSMALILVLPPIYFFKLYHLSSLHIGLMVFSAPLGIILMARRAGRLIDQFGEKHLMFSGLLCMLVALLGLAFYPEDWSYYGYMPLLLFFGLGGGTFQAPNMAQLMKSVPLHDQGAMGAVNRMVHNLGNGLGVSFGAFFIGMAVSISAHDVHIGIAHAWLFASVVIAVVMLLFIGEWWWLRRTQLK
jgi:EmrB/QacA subfamily drug resistance transporter